MSRHKQKNPRPSRKIVPLTAPAPYPWPGLAAKSRVVLAEFAVGTRSRSASWNLVKVSKSDAPRIGGYGCSAAWAVMNDPATVARFGEVAAELGNVRTLYHGTSSGNILQIAAEGLLPGHKNCMFGSGIYMGSPQKAVGFTSGWRIWRSSDGQTGHYILRVRAALGRILVSPVPRKYHLQRLRSEGFDSVAGVAGQTTSWVGTLRHSENVVYSPDQVLVERVYEYQSDGAVTIAEKPRTGKCAHIRHVDGTYIRPGMSAFRDILSQKVCGATAYTRLNTTDGLYWFCADCIRNNKLKVGSRVQVQVAGTYWGTRRPNKEVRITGVADFTA